MGDYDALERGVHFFPTALGAFLSVERLQLENDESDETESLNEDASEKYRQKALSWAARRAPGAC